MLNSIIQLLNDIFATSCYTVALSNIHDTVLWERPRSYFVNINSIDFKTFIIWFGFRKLLISSHTTPLICCFTTKGRINQLNRKHLSMFFLLFGFIWLEDYNFHNYKSEIFSYWKSIFRIIYVQTCLIKQLNSGSAAEWTTCLAASPQVDKSLQIRNRNVDFGLLIVEFVLFLEFVVYSVMDWLSSNT